MNYQPTLWQYVFGTGRTLRHSRNFKKVPSKQNNTMSKTTAKANTANAQSKPKTTTVPATKSDFKANKMETTKAEESFKDPKDTPAPTTTAQAVEPGPDSFTAAQDTLLLELKAANKTWKEIATALGRESVSGVKARFKSLKDGGLVDSTSVQPQPSEEHQCQTQNQGKDNKVNENANGNAKITSGTTVVSGGQEAKKDEPGEVFTPDELILLHALLYNDSHATTHRIAARFFDETGRRVHPDDIMLGLGAKC